MGNNMADLEIEADDDSSVAVSVGVGGETTLEQAEAKQERHILGEKESRMVAWLRVIVFVVLLITAVLVSLGVFFYARGDEEDDFESEFAANAAKVIGSFHEAVERKLNAIDTMSVMITTFVLSTEASFPNVTFPNIEYLGANTRIGADGTLVFWVPLVTDDTRKGFEAFTDANKGQLLNTFLLENGLRAKQDARYGIGGGDNDRALQEDPYADYHPQIFGLLGDDEPQPEGAGIPMLPIWQSSPALPLVNILNFDILSHPGSRGGCLALLARETAVIDIAANLEKVLDDEDDTSKEVYNFFLSLGQNRHNAAEYTGDPTSSMVYPVFSDFSENRTLAGVLNSNLYWSFYFTDILPPTARGIIAILENSQNQSFTYRINGPDVEYLGDGDMHEPQYDDMVVSLDVSSIVKASANPATRSYTTVDLDDEYCTYRLRVYPSSEMEDDYVTNEPIIFTIIVAVTFVFTSLVFVSYDCIVARRQRIVMDRAMASGAIVSSLFPEKVRNQLYEENQEKAKQVANSKDFMNNGGAGGNDIKSSRPIADLFENTTILFADLVGFTAWSSKRTPVEVFELLEAIYSVFDAIAVKRGVFKIETIGDCYVAVTGIPNPQSEHAVIMARFARDCMARLNELTHDLAATMGADTADLDMRVGLHSGSTTAGVLRGDKSRFQLFGDTVNTAARMESNGVRGRIHVSESTALALSTRGKGHWVSPREDKIVAKGKGEMQTYWVQIKSEGSAASTSVYSSLGTSAQDEGEGLD